MTSGLFSNSSKPGVNGASKACPVLDILHTRECCDMEGNFLIAMASGTGQRGSVRTHILQVVVHVTQAPVRVRYSQLVCTLKFQTRHLPQTKSRSLSEPQLLKFALGMISCSISWLQQAQSHGGGQIRGMSLLGHEA